MPTITFDLTPELNSFITDKVASGEFKDASEVVQTALQILEREVLDYEAKMDAIQQALDEGDASGIAEGDVFAELRRQLGLPVRAAVS